MQTAELQKQQEAEEALQKKAAVEEENRTKLTTEEDDTPPPQARSGNLPWRRIQKSKAHSRVSHRAT